MDHKSIFAALGLNVQAQGVSDGQDWKGQKDDKIICTSPIDGRTLGVVESGNDENIYHWVVDASIKAFATWRSVPAPLRGDIVRQLGNELRRLKEPLGALVTLEMGKGYQEGLGEVQEMIDICDYAVGLSRQLYGVTTHSERAGHRMYEQWHPYGPTAIITAFNFPVAVWAWNTALALVCGNTVIWKPSEHTPLVAIACQKILAGVLEQNSMPHGVSTLIVGAGAKVGQWIADDKRIPLVSFTGSTNVGKVVSSRVGRRLGRAILELGGNNAAIVTPRANLELAADYVFFGWVGTAGQRCTSTRRVIVHNDVYDEFIAKLNAHIEKSLVIGSPMSSKTTCGPLINPQSTEAFFSAIQKVNAAGGKVLFGGSPLPLDKNPGGCYVQPCMVEVFADCEPAMKETFAPLLYIIRYDGSLQEGIAIHNQVSQGLSSAIFSDHIEDVEEFLSCRGSDCGIANVNIGTSGAEIGLAFGGEKDTGGGRESGSDAWKGYMRRQSSTINYTGQVSLAQGIQFGEEA